MPDESLIDFPNEAQLAALRAWYAGMGSREAIERYLPGQKQAEQSARGMIGRIRAQLIAIATEKRQAALLQIFAHPEKDKRKMAGKVINAIDQLKIAVVPQPLISDAIGMWFSDRTARTLKAHDIATLADLTVRIPRRKRWWLALPGLGAVSAKKIETFFVNHPQLTAKARALIPQASPEIVPWENLPTMGLPGDLNGARGTFRAPRTHCTLDAGNDYEAVQAWLSLHENKVTHDSYRKEVERLILWSIKERGRALSSLTTEDAVAYRQFLRHPLPRSRWIGPARPHASVEWKPFVGPLSPRSVAYALTVINGLFRWLMDKGYMLSNPFSGIKVKGAKRASAMEISHTFTSGEWQLIRSIADGLEWSYDWQEKAAQRLRFILDFAYTTGLRASELVGATLGAIEKDGRGDYWLHVIGKGQKIGKVALPPMAKLALEQYLVARGLPTTPRYWKADTPLIDSLQKDQTHADNNKSAVQKINAVRVSGITSARLRKLLERFFETVATAIESEKPALAAKVRLATPHWMRHTHATHSLAKGVDLTTVRDNLRHTSIATTSIYLHGDDIKRAKQMREAFGG